MTKADYAAIAGIWKAAQAYFASAKATDLAALAGHYAAATKALAEVPTDPERNDIYLGHVQHGSDRG